MHEVFIVGCGDVGSRVAARWQARGVPVNALARSADSTARLQGRRLRAVAGDLDEPVSLRRIAVHGMLVYYFAPPPTEGGVDPRVRHWLAALDANAHRPEKIVYLSTTGVYGNTDGGWVSEDTPCAPQTARGMRRLDAENTLRDWGRGHQVPVVILRVPGIYGPGRLPVSAIKAHRPVVAEVESGFTNRIHSEDLADICVAAAERGRPDTIYNVSDGHPGTLAGYYNAVADALGLPRPPVVSRDEAGKVLSQGMLSYLRESRRIDNRRMLQELGVTLRYPTLEAGLKASIAAEAAVANP